MECFEPPEDPQQLLARLEVIAKHSAPALYNAVEYRRIPLRFLWLPLAKLQAGVGGQAKALSLLITVAMVSTVTAAVGVPYPLKREASGQLLPQTRRVIYAPEEGAVEFFDVLPGETIPVGRNLGLMRSKALEDRILTLRADILTARSETNRFEQEASTEVDEAKRAEKQGQANKQRALAASKQKELDELMDRTSADQRRPGYYWLQ